MTYPNKKTSKKKTQKHKLSGKKKKTQRRTYMESTTYEKSVQEPWFSLIQNGIKKIEGRPKKGFFDSLKQGDIIIWTNDITGTQRQCKTLITNVRYYKTFHQMIETEMLVNVLPAPGAGIKTIEDGVNKVYRQWYDVNVEKKYGVCAIEMKVID